MNKPGLQANKSISAKNSPPKLDHTTVLYLALSAAIIPTENYDSSSGLASTGALGDIVRLAI